jgi:hypothetical protein
LEKTMFHTPAHKQTDPAKLPAQIRLDDQGQPAQQVERACSTCLHYPKPAHAHPCHVCLPRATTLPRWTPKALTGVRAGEALIEIQRLIAGLRAKHEGRETVADIFELNACLDKAHELATDALAQIAIAQRQQSLAALPSLADYPY